MSRNDSSDPLPFTQVDRAVKAKAAVLASAIGINYQQALGSLIEFWDLNGDPREIEKLVANDVHEVVLDGREVALRFKIASGQDVDVQVLTRTGFLEPIGDRFRVRGMSRYFKPVEKRIMRRKLGSIAGLASAESRKTKYGSAQPGVVLVDQIPTNAEPTTEPTPNQTRTKPEPNAEPKGNLEDRGQRSESLNTNIVSLKARRELVEADGQRFLEEMAALDEPAQVDLDQAADVVIETVLATAPRPKHTTATWATDERDVFEHWRVACAHTRAVPTPERRKLIAKQLKFYGCEDLQAAIDGCAESEWHRANNQTSLELILRDAKHIEDFIGRTRVGAL